MMSGPRADLNEDADKLRSALHEVFTKIDEECDRHFPILGGATVGIMLQTGMSSRSVVPRAFAAKEARLT